MENQNQPNAKTVKIIAIIAITLGILGIVKYIWDAHRQVDPLIQNQPIGTPTLFIHGYGGSVNSEKYFASQAEKQGITKHTLQADVAANGQVTLKGKLDKDEKHPIVLVNLKDNRNADFKQNALWIRNVLEALQQHYSFKQFNVVTHSMSNMSFAYYMLNYSSDNQLPKLNKQVNIAGTFNGIIGIDDEPNKVKLDKNGKPDQMTDNYIDLLKLRELSTYKNVDVLNIYGDVEDGTHSDQRVTNASSKSLKYLLGNQAKSYQEQLIKGKDGQHSQLHESKQVADKVIDFLWK